MASRAAKNRAGKRTKQPYVGLLVFLAIVVGVLCAGGAGLWALGNEWLKDLPDYTDVDAYNTAQKTTVLASDESTVLAEFYVENREPVNWDEVNDYVKKGTIATEDERFYEHGGFDLWGIMRSVVVNLMGGQEGASTITQQFVRNTILLDEMNEISFKRKVREIYIAVKLEEQYTKDEILLMYLNTINYGNGAYGIQAAAQEYFSKDASDLSIVEAATLIGIPQSPTANNPLENPDTCEARRNVVLDRMRSNGVITQEEYDAAIATPLSDYLNPTQDDDSNNGIYLYPYFTSYVRQLLLEQYDQNEVFKGGLTVVTTLDLRVQEAAEAAAATKRESMSDEYDVAFTVIDPDDGYIKALIGGRDFQADQYNLATQAYRSPGSSFKTFTLVGALEEGVSPQTMVDCSSPANINGYELENYNGASYGTRTMASAFAISSNTGFVRLSEYIGADRVAETANRMGIETELPANQSLTLGTTEVTTKEMAQAYATIANGGTAREGQAIQKITDRNGKTIFEADTTGTKALEPEIAYAATQVMEGVLTNGTGTQAMPSCGQVAAGKTGTSENWRDSYFCGITPQYSVAIWVGSRTEAQMPESLTAASVFADFIDRAMEGQPHEEFPTAGQPTYRSDVYDANLHIGSGSYSYDGDDDDDDDSDNDGHYSSGRNDSDDDSAASGGTSHGTSGPSTGGTIGGGASGGISGGTGGTGGEIGGGASGGGGDVGGGDVGGGDIGGGGGDVGGGDVNGGGGETATDPGGGGEASSAE